jgi:hypothetical protein
MNAKTAKKGRVYQSAKMRHRQGMAGIVRVRKRARASQRVNTQKPGFYVSEGAI